MAIEILFHSTRKEYIYIYIYIKQCDNDFKWHVFKFIKT